MKAFAGAFLIVARFAHCGRLFLGPHKVSFVQLCGDPGTESAAKTLRNVPVGYGQGPMRAFIEFE